MNTGMLFKVIDNTGARWASCIGVLGNSRTCRIRVGSVIKVVVKDADPASQKVNRKNNAKCVFTALIVSLKKANNSKFGVFKNYRENSVILLRKDTKGKYIPVGNAVNGCIDYTCWSTVQQHTLINQDAMGKMLLGAVRVY